MKNFLIACVAIYLTWFIFFKQEAVVLGPGVFAPETPQQSKIASPNKFKFDEFIITPLAQFELKAKVLGKENYSRGREAELSPTDLAFGWGRMSDEAVIEQLDISQSGRWYRWNTKSNGFPIPRREIETSSANMHIIPKNDSVRHELKKIRQGDIVRLKGRLVRVDAQDGWHWKSSLTRSDTGGGACELIFVESLEIESVL